MMLRTRHTTLTLLSMLLASTAHVPAIAQETQPGDACVAGETGYFRRSGDDNPGPAVTGQNFMFCDGSNWISFLHYDDPTSSILLSAPNAAPADGTFNNSEWSLWLDETSDEFELKAKKSNGTVINATVGGGGGGGGLWTDDTTHISYQSTHIVKSGQTLPATMDDIGTRMFFYPDKKAFRGGRISGASTAWQDANIGSDSFSWGWNATASGYGSVSMGWGQATDGYAVAMGSYAVASNYASVAMGDGTTASGWASVAMGVTTTASGKYDVAMGWDNTASGGYGSVAMGAFNDATARASVAMGGQYNTASGRHSVAMGRYSTASGRYSVAMGRNNTASGEGAVAMGKRVVVGDSLFVSSNKDLGSQNPDVGEGSMGFGLQTASHTTWPKITGDRSAVFFFDGNTANANNAFDFTDDDKFALVGGEFVISETQAQGAAAGCIRFESTSNALEYSDDCSGYTAFNAIGGLWTAGAGDDIYFNSGTHNVGIGLTNPDVELDVDGDIEYTGTIADVSDRRLKTDIENLPEGQLDKLLKLEGVTFKMKNDPEGPTEYGFIAQDVKPIYASLVYERSTEGMMSMNYIGLIAPMVEAIKEQNEIIKKQGELIEQLEARLQALEDQAQ